MDNKEFVSSGKAVPLTGNNKEHGDDRSVFKQMMQEQGSIKEEPVSGKPVVLAAVTALSGILGLIAGKTWGMDVIAAVRNILSLLNI